ncbi:MAG: helix-turn-helix domain-containing protein [Parasphingorhabdus sp.]
MDIRLKLASNARYYRERLGLSQEAIAVKIGADRAYVSMIERGKQNMTLVRLAELADALGVDATDLIATPQEPEQD